MTVGMENFYKLAPKKNEEIRDVDNKISESGDLEEIYGAVAIIKNILRHLLIIQGTYLFDPELGMGLQKFIFEPSDQETLSKMKSKINNAIYNYAGKADITYDIIMYRNQKGFIINFNVYYKGKNKKFTTNISESLLDPFDETLTSYIKETA